MYSGIKVRKFPTGKAKAISALKLFKAISALNPGQLQQLRVKTDLCDTS